MALFGDTGSGFISPVFGQETVQGDAGGNTAGDGAGNTDLPPRKRSFLAYFVQSLGFSFGLTFLALSVCDVALIMINVFVIRRPAIMPAPLVEQFTTLLDNKQYQEAYELAKESDSFVGKVLAAGLAKIGGGYEAIQKSMQDVGDEELMTMEHRLSLLALIANISPMIGLLGTVVGMVESFQVIANSSAAPQASKLAEGVSTALVTTEVGLFIAIPSIVAYDILRNMLAKLILEVTFVTDNLMSRFK
jgi:biopolymer transport protein ExbB